ncbi:unnamed protein product [Somion occarium]
MTTRTLTFKSSDLGENANLVLCFATSETIDAVPGTRVDANGLKAKQYPIAWKTATLSAHGYSSLTTTFVNSPGFCSAQIGGRRVVTAGNYVPIQVGQETTLNVETNVRPPVFYFSDPTSIIGDIVKATNLTGQAANIGLGFITDAEQPNETMIPTSVFRNVPNGLSILDTFTPLLRAYIDIGNYTEGQLIDRDLSNVQPVWEGDLLSLQPETTIVLQGSVVPVQPRLNLNATVINTTHDQVPPVVVHLPKVEIERRERVYTATLAFALAENVVQGVKYIAEQLINKNYQVKFTYTEGSTFAVLVLTLPYGTSCDQAERELLSVMESHLRTPLSPKSNGTFNSGINSTGSNGHGFFDGNDSTLRPRISIKGRSGSQVVSAGENFSYWVEINPASNEWFVGGTSGNTYIKPTSQTRIRANSTRSYLSAVSSVLDNVASNLNGLGVQVGGVPVTKNRPLSRKSSAIGLNTVAVY